MSRKKRRDRGPRMGPARALLEYVPIRVAQIALRLLPRRIALAAGRLVGRIAYMIDLRHRAVALENIRSCLKEITDPREQRRIARACFEHFGVVGVECLLMPYRRAGEAESLAVWEGLEHLRQAQLKGKGVFVISGHMGNWEMVALLQGWAGIPMAMVTRPLDNPRLERLLAAGRQSSGNRIIHKESAVRAMMRALRESWAIALVIDQDFKRSDRIFVDFFGRPAATAPTLGLLALRTRAPIVPVVSRILPDGRYLIRYLPAVEYTTSGDREADVLGIMTRCTRILEDEIRANPEQWLWMHRRWKTRPKPGQLPPKEEEKNPWNSQPTEQSSSTGTAH